MPDLSANIRDIPGLDDRLVRFLEQVNANVNQLLALHIQNRDAINKTSSAVPNIAQIRDGLEATGDAPLNVEALRGKLGQSQLANIPKLSSLPALSDITYEDGDAVSVSNIIYIRNRSTDPGSWDPISAGAVGSNPSFTTVDVSSHYKVGGTKVVGAQGAAVSAPAGGATQDAEARTAITDILNRLRASTGHGLIAG